MKQLPLASEAYRYCVASFKEWLQTTGYSEQTVYQLPNYIQEFLHFAEGKGYVGLFQLSSELMKEHYYQLKGRRNTRRGGALSNAYLNKHLQAYQKFGDYLRQSGRLVLGKLDIRTEPDENTVTDILTKSEVQLLYEVTQLPYEIQKNDKGPVFQESLQARDRAMLAIFYGCGLRRNEGVHLDIGDINLHSNVLHVRRGKNHQERFVPITGTSAAHLQHYLYDARPYLISEKCDAFFLSYTGKRLGGQQLLNRLNVLIRLTGNARLLQKDIHLHTLRHSIATHLLHNGMKLERIKEFLGHSSLESTQLYTHFITEQPF